MPRPRKPATAHLTDGQRREVASLRKSLRGARARDAHKHARIDRATAVVREAGVAPSTVRAAVRRLNGLSASRQLGEAKLVAVLGRLEALGLSPADITSGLIVVDAEDDRKGERCARDSAGLARGDRKEATDKRADELRAAYGKELAAQRTAAKGARFNIGEVYEAVATAFAVSTRTVRRAVRR